MKSRKFKSVNFSNKKKEIYLIYNSGKEITLHYSDLGFSDLIDEAWIDKDTGRAAIGFKLSNGDEEFMPYDQPLSLKQDSEYQLQTQIEQLVFRINQTLTERKISKKYIARQLETSDNQIQRLLDPNILNKNLTQLYRLGALIDLDMKLLAA